MTPKEKAQELFDKYFEQMLLFGFHLSNSQINKFALIAIDEVLGYMGADRGYEFWTEVKKELEQL